MYRSDREDCKVAHLIINDTQQIQNYINNGLIKNHYHFSSIMFIENIPNEEIYQQMEKYNSLLINYKYKFYSNEEHATINLLVPYVFRADIMHASIPPLSEIRAAS